MHNKKKITTTKKAPTKKKPQKLPNDNLNSIFTTEQRTFATIEQAHLAADAKLSPRTTQNTSRRQCIDRMQANKLSPFSSPDNSISPKTDRPGGQPVVKSKPTKKMKKIYPTEQPLKQERKSKSPIPITKNTKTKKRTAEVVKAEFENQFLKRMHKFTPFHQKKITEVSEEEMQASLRKTSKGSVLIKLPNRKQSTARIKKNRVQIIRDMHRKIKQKCKQQNPTLNPLQIKVLSAIILIQKLWKQSKVKSIIGQFLSPRAPPLTRPTTTQSSGKLLLIRTDSPKQNLPTTNNINLPFCQIPSSLTPTLQHNNQPQLPKLKDNQPALFLPTQRVQLNLHDLEISDELSTPISQNKVRQYSKYVENYRQILLTELKSKINKKSSKPNTFNLTESLSQKCLLQNLYRRRVIKMTGLPGRKQEKIQIMEVLIPVKIGSENGKQRGNCKKGEIVELEERFYTEAREEEQLSMDKIGKTAKQPLKPKEQTVGSISSIGQQVVQFLINQFSQQFEAFTTKKCLKKKKRLPGIPITSTTISRYLTELITHIRTHHKTQFESSFTKITAHSLLKIFRVFPEWDIFDEGSDDDEEDLNYPMLPNETFFEYQPIYQETIFQLREEDRKYANFITGLIKIHNKCLFDCLSEFIEKERIESIELPWDVVGSVRSEQNIKKNLEFIIGNKISHIEGRIVQIADTQLGKLSKKDTEAEELCLLACLRDQYRWEGKDWNQHQQLLEIRLELAEAIMEQILVEAAGEWH